MSNPSVHENVWLRYLAADDERPNAEHRRRERLVYTYLQRLCGKNETASFFGPMAYGEVAGDGWAEVELLPPAAARRRVLFSHWAVELLARAVNEEPDLAAHLPLRLNPLLTVEGDRVRLRGQAAGARVPRATAALLAAVQRGAGSLAAAAREAGCGEADAERALAPLLRAGLARRGLAIEGEDVDLLAQLLAGVRALPASDARDRWRARLEELGRLAGEFEAAGLDGRRRLLPEIERRFTACTGAPARRGEGRIYADRLVVFEEAASRFRLRVGRRLARWLEAAVGAALELSAAYGESVQAGYRRQVAGRHAPGGRQSLVEYVAALAPDDLRREHALPPVRARLTPGAATAELDPCLCGAPSPGGRYALLDLCLGTPAVDRAEAPPLVLVSRVHHQLLLSSWLTMFHPDQGRVERSARRWLAAQPEAPVALVTRRHNKSFYRFPGRRVSLDVLAPAAAGTLRADEVTVVAGAGGPELHDAGDRPFRLYLPLADHSTLAALAAFAHPLVLHAPIQGDDGDTPRLHAGGAVYQRRRWRVPAAHLPRRQGADLLVEVARLRRRYGWSRFVYVRLADERKPYLVDLESPFACDLLRHLAGRAGELSVEEMLPAPDQLWLRDERGRYTCELRWQADRWEP
jgi:hypothetical protein